VGIGYFVWQRRRVISFVCIAILLLILTFGKEGRALGDLYHTAITAPESDHRLASYYYSTAIWMTAPLMGHGIGSYRHHSKPMGSDNDTPDNMYLLILAEQGVFGLAVRLYLIVLLIQNMYKIYPQNKIEKYKKDNGYTLLNWADLLGYIKYDGLVQGQLNRAFIAGLLGFCVNMLTWDALYFPLTRIQFWVIAGLGAAQVAVVHDSDKLKCSYGSGSTENED